jgi:hypothetical protein
LAKHCFQYFEENFYPEIEIKLWVKKNWSRYYKTMKLI